jgi:predicted TIM-barrel fold metal-dependent hydrolase
VIQCLFWEHPDNSAERNPTMTIRAIDKSSDAAQAAIPSFMISADSHAPEAEKLWKSLPSNILERIPLKRVLGARPEGCKDAKSRLADMDRDGVTAEVLFPDSGLVVFGLDPDVQGTAFPRYNDWLAEYCATSPKRLFGVTALSVYDIDKAIKEMQRGHDMGLYGGLLWEVPDPKLPFHSPHYEKLWAAAEELGTPIALHILTGYSYAKNRTRGFEHIRGSVNTKTYDTTNSLYDIIWSGVFDRYPKLKLALVESEIGWLPFILQQWDYYYHRFSQPGPQQVDIRIKRPPSEIFNEHIYATFMDDYVGSRALSFWGQKNCMWSSDYPHGNMTWPESRSFAARQIGDLPQNVQAQLLSQNVIDLFKLKI